MEWMSVNFDNSAQVLEQLTNEFPDLGPDSIAKVWGLIFSHVFQGRTADASRLLKFTNQGDGTSQISLMSELMLKMPKFVPGTGSVTQFDAACNHWHKECENRLTQRAFQGSDKLTLLAQVYRAVQVTNTLNRCNDFNNNRKQQNRFCAGEKKGLQVLKHTCPLGTSICP